MTDEYQALAFKTLGKPISYFQPRQHLPDSVTLDSPAIDVMTDLSQVTAVTARMTMPIHEALQRMRKRAVRLLLVTDLDDGTVYGLITARDIQGEKPVKLAQKLGYEPSQLVVRDLMTLKGRLEVLPYDAVVNAKVGNIVASLRDSGRQHALVVDADPDRDGVPAVRGIISLAHIGRQMGLDLDTAERATTYAELEAALGE